MRWTFELKITLAYVIIGGLYIRFSDLLVEATFSDPDVLTRVQSYKGWAYVAVTGVFLYVLLKRHLRDLRAAERRARRGEQMAQAFLQNISHEVRTPMNGIMGIAEILRTHEYSREEQHSYLETLQGSSHQLLNLVNDILDISRIESETMPIKKSRVNLPSLLKELDDQWKGRADASVSFCMESDLPNELADVNYDATRLKQAFNNVIDNAFKFTQEGTVSFSASHERSTFHFCIKDTGKGIKRDELPSLFKYFRRDADLATGMVSSRRLGLAITKGLIELMGGRIEIKSTEGEGTEVHIFIPVEFADEKVNGKEYVSA